MATVEAKKNDEIRESTAHLSKFFLAYERRLNVLEEMVKDLRGLRHSVVTLLNAEEIKGRLVKDAEARIAKAENEAQNRLATVEQGHRALIDRLSKKEIELDSKRADVEARERVVVAERQKYELLNAELERKLAGVEKVTQKK